MQAEENTEYTAHAAPTWAIACERVEDLARAVADGRLSPGRGGWDATLTGGTPVRFTRLYAGEEFCEHLVPEPRAFDALLAAADEVGVPVTFATPPLTDAGLDELEPLLDRLAGREGAEVLVNDWGTLRRASQRHPALGRVLGRALCRQIKDPRAENATASAALAPAYHALLERRGVSLVSMDRLPEGEPPLPLAVHLPYEFVTTGRVCSVSGVAFPAEAKKFKADFVCPRPCRDFTLRLSDPRSRAPIHQKGNTLYAPNGGADLVEAGAGRVTRWVYDLSIDQGALLAPARQEAMA